MEQLLAISRMRHALAAAVAHAATDTSDALVDAVYATTRTLRDDGWPIERIIVQIKHLATEAGYPATSIEATAGSPDEPVAVPLEDVIRHAIEAYYEDGARTVPQPR
jgi:hypothetical protein